MCIIKSKRIYRITLLLYIISFMFSGGELKAMTISEIREISNENHNFVNTARLVYVKERIDHRPLSDEEGHLIYLRKIHKHTIVKVDAVLDVPSQKVKATVTDLRDLDSILKNYNLSSEEKKNITSSKTVLYENGYEAELADANTLGHNSVALFEDLGLAKNYLKTLTFGIVHPKWLSEELNPTVTEVECEGEQKTEIRFIKNGEVKIEGIIECDPSLGYHFRRFRLFKNGKLIQEKNANNYKISNGVAYPSLYIDRFFGEDGDILFEKRYEIKNAEFGIELSESDFSLFIPAGTAFTDTVLTGTFHKIEQDSYMNITDIINIGNAKMADKLIQDLNIMPNQKKVHEINDIAVVNKANRKIFIPHMKIAIARSKPFILELQNSELVNIEKENKADNELIYKQFETISKGDIAWNGELLLLRKSKIFASDRNLSGRSNHDKWGNSYNLTSKKSLPCFLGIINKEGVKFLVTIEKINTNGIIATINKFHAKDIEKYHMIEGQQKLR